MSYLLFDNIKKCQIGTGSGSLINLSPRTGSIINDYESAAPGAVKNIYVSGT
jgi:hypothetical protein